ncbi:alpha/beta fold hydrolase [Saccharopolyspora phatthalungensis]|uniref:3-oxoadipate enol-lactonase n=1 Tax=Saccharopolyspora phatthalungensis TaxID=664693 RepID=A0A840QBM8_9PSEU|nr:alpha/beta fold hydrolase [Saccharopolyspora phatthalungensis]MBB5154263.1 3-oxoadipate enol-lactonase [Saccharopolyspora phatthalungensis]
MTRWEQLGLEWRESGHPDAPVLVLGNALGCTWGMWDPQLDVLNSAYRVIRYNQRGHGESPVEPGPYTLAGLAEDVLALLDHLEVPRASFMGSSLGGMIGLWLGAHAGARIDGLTVCGTSAWLGQEQRELARAAIAREHGTNELVSPTIERWFTPYFREWHAETAVYAAMIASTDDEAYAWCEELIGSVDLRADLSAIAAPTLVVAGAEDPATPPEHSEAIVSGIGDNARLVVLPHAAHLANVEQAEAFNELLGLD